MCFPAHVHLQTMHQRRLEQSRGSGILAGIWQSQNLPLPEEGHRIRIREQRVPQSLIKAAAGAPAPAAIPAPSAASSTLQAGRGAGNNNGNGCRAAEWAQHLSQENPFTHASSKTSFIPFPSCCLAAFAIALPRREFQIPNARIQPLSTSHQPTKVWAHRERGILITPKAFQLFSRRKHLFGDSQMCQGINQQKKKQKRKGKT